MQGPNRNIQSGIKYKYYQACEEKLIVSYFYFLILDLYFYWSSSLTCTCLCGLNDMDVQFCPKDFLINRLLHFVGKYENFFKLSNSIQRYSDNLQINYSITHIIIKKMITVMYTAFHKMFIWHYAYGEAVTVCRGYRVQHI